MKFEDFLQQSSEFIVTVGENEKGWTLITLTAGDLEERYSVHGSVVTPVEMKTAPPQ